MSDLDERVTLLKTIAHAAPADAAALLAIPGFRQSGLAEVAPAVLGIIAAGRAA